MLMSRKGMFIWLQSVFLGLVLMNSLDPRKYKKRGGLKTSGTSSSKKK